MAQCRNCPEQAETKLEMIPEGWLGVRLETFDAIFFDFLLCKNCALKLLEKYNIGQ